MSISQYDLIRFLKSDVMPALGCTEPVCVALAAANAAEHLIKDPYRISVIVNPNIYKNGMSAGIPNFDKVGLEYAAALGTCLKNPDKKLELLKDVTDQIRSAAEDLVLKGNVSVLIDEQKTGLYVSCTLFNSEEECTCVIENAHTNVVSIIKNGEMIYQADTYASGREEEFIDELLKLTISDIRVLVERMNAEALSFMMDGVIMNERLADYSIHHRTGNGIAESLRKLKGGEILSDDLMTRIQINVAAAAENRLDGCPYPTMSSSGAGTKGLVVILPISETAKAVGASREKTVKALAFGHLVNRYINGYIGKLSPMCTCAVASSTAACAAMTYLMGGSDVQIGHAIRSMTGTVTGMICDGGKVGCALKVACSSSAALICALTCINGAKLRVSDGICAETPEKCIKNIARIAQSGMRAADREILGIMLEKNAVTSRLSEKQ